MEELAVLEERVRQLLAQKQRSHWRVGELIALIHARVASGWGAYKKLKKLPGNGEEESIWKNFTEAQYDELGRATCLKRIRDERRTARAVLQDAGPTPSAPKQKKPKSQKLKPTTDVVVVGKRSMKELLLGLRAGEVTFAEFARAAQRDVRALAASLYRCWQVPASIDIEDLEQEMLLAAWQAVGRWDPAKASINGFVVFSMCDRAKKAIHKERAALRRDGKAQSRHAVPFSTLTEDGSMPEFAKSLWSEESDGMPVLLGVPLERKAATLAFDGLRSELLNRYPEYERPISALFESGLEKDRAARLLYSWTKDERWKGDSNPVIPSLGMARRIVKATAALCGLEATRPLSQRGPRKHGEQTNVDGCRSIQGERGGPE